MDVVSTVARSRAGTITDETLGGVDARPSAPNYVHDAAGRLTQAMSGAQSDDRKLARMTRLNHPRRDGGSEVMGNGTVTGLQRRW